MHANRPRRCRRIRPLPPRILQSLGIEPHSRVRSLDAAGQRQVQTYSPLAYQMANRFARLTAPDVPADELISEALFGLTYAAGMFDEARGVPFGAYATLVIRHRLMQAINRWRRAGRIVPLPAPIEAPDELWEVEDRRPVADAGAGMVAREMCDEVRRTLPVRWYTILHLHHVEGHSLEEVGHRLGITRARVQQLIAKATRHARECFPRWTFRGGPSPN